MLVDLSEEMIAKVCLIAFSYKQDLREKEKLTKECIAVGQDAIKRKHILLNGIKKAKQDADDVHKLFLELLEGCE
jgi:biotin synthase-related radical SAM superfamily protein